VFDLCLNSRNRARHRLTETTRLDRRAHHRTVGTETQQSPGFGRNIVPQPMHSKEPAGISRHGLGFGCAAMRTGNDGFKDHGFSQHMPISEVPWADQGPSITTMSSALAE
jgi:hypothetical protein